MIFGLLLTGIIVLVAWASEILSRITRIPNIVYYLLFAIIIGPIGVGFLHPGILIPNIDLLDLVIAMALALIVFEGGYSFNRCFKIITDKQTGHQRKDCKPLPFRRLFPKILRLVMIAGIITAVLMMFLFVVLAGFPLELAILGGVLCAITGPTVINPILRELQVEEEVAETLQGEGEFNDGIFAVVAAAIFSGIILELSGLGAVILIPLQILIAISLGFLAGSGLGMLGIAFTKYIEPKIMKHYRTRLNPSIWTAIEQMGLLCIAFIAYGLGSLIGLEAAIISTLSAGILLGQRHRFQNNNSQLALEKEEAEIR